MKRYSLSFLLAAAMPSQDTSPSAVLIEQWERAARHEAAELADRPVPRSEPALRPGIAYIDQVVDPWVPVREDDFVRVNSHPRSIYRRKTHYSVRIALDYDRDGHMDIAELVQNSRQAGIRVTFGKTKARRSVIFKMTGRWEQEELLPAGKHRIYLLKPELGYTLFFRQNGQDRAYYAGN